MKNIYFLSDAHLGSLALKHRRTQERRLVNFLDSIKHKAEAVYLMGDVFDFWFEYKTVVPKGYTRFLGKVAELSDLGVEVHFFTGNHDMWCGDYLEKECGVVIHRKPEVCELHGKLFFLAHGDGLGDTDKKFLFLRRVFHNEFLRRCYASIHPRWAIPFGMNWAKKSRMQHQDAPYQGERNEKLVLFAKEYLKAHPEVNYFVFGHRHIELDLMLTRTARLFVLGDWFHLFTYLVYDGENIFLENYVEGESDM